MFKKRLTTMKICHTIVTKNFCRKEYDVEKIRISLVRLRGNRTQNEMAQVYGTSQQNWFHWETGVSRPRDYSLMERIARDADSTVGEIFFASSDRKKLLNKPCETADCL